MAEARTKISLDSGSFEKGAKAVTNAANSMATGVKAAFATAGAAVLLAFGAKGVSSLLSTVRETFEFGEAMANAGRRAGLAAGQFYLFNAAVNKGIGLKTAASLIGKNAEVLNRSANLFRDVSIKLWAIGEQIRGFWLGLLERLSPVLSRILDGGLGTALLDAGDRFGAALAKAVEVVYQLAKDGKLWETMKSGFGIAFDYAGERMIWLAQIGFKLLKEMFTDSFVDGVLDAISFVWESIKTLGQHIGEQIGEAFFNAWTAITELVYGLMNSLEGLLLKIGAMSEEDVETRKQERAENIVNRKIVGAVKPDVREGTDFVARIKDLFEKNAFKPSGDLAARIEEFAKGLTGAATKYGSASEENPARAFENNLPIKTYGADSLAQIGGGGGVYMGLSVLDVNKQQLREQRRTNEILMRMGGGNVQAVIRQFAMPAAGITRTQTTPVSGVSPASAH